MPSNWSPRASRSHTEAPQGRRATRRSAAAAHLGRGHQLAAAVEDDRRQVVRRALVADGEGGQPVDLVAPQVDAHRHVGRGGEHVDDPPAHGELPAVLDLVLAPVALVHQPVQQRVEVDLIPAPDDDGRVRVERRQALQQRPHRGDDHARRGWQRDAVAPRRGQRVQHGQAPAHGLGLGADPLEGERLPRRQHGHRAAECAGDRSRRARPPPPVPAGRPGRRPGARRRGRWR